MIPTYLKESDANFILSENPNECVCSVCIQNGQIICYGYDECIKFIDSL